MSLTRADVEKVALLARLKLSDAELETFTTQLAKIIEYVQLLDETETDSVEPMAHAVDRTDVFRTDEPRPCLPRDAALAGAPKTDGRYFLVPPILEGD
ncbi:MAG: Asp-tRNA(Asn)/Glu-tRNA(Gln) amidotransferase subunit GatC [Planctomycetaceae bacterium]